MLTYHQRHSVTVPLVNFKWGAHELHPQHMFGVYLFKIITISPRGQWRNSPTSAPSAAYMLQWTGSALVQVLACRLFGAKPLPQPLKLIVNWTLKEQTSVKVESNYNRFHSRKGIWRCRLRNDGHLAQRERLIMKLIIFSHNQPPCIRCDTFMVTQLR